jgi:type II secretory pathway component HofQ
VDDATRRAVKEQRKGGEPSSQSSDAESNSLNAQEAPSTLFNAHLSAEDDPLRQVVDLEFKEMPLENIVQILEDLGQVKIVTGLPLDAIVSANLEEIPLGRAMETIFRMQGLGFVREDDGFRITTWDEAVKARRERIEGKTEERAIPPYKVAIQVKYAKEADLVPAVTLVLSESGTVKFDARSGHLLVTDTPAKVEEIRALVESLDVIDDIEQYEKTQTLNRELKRLKAEEKAIREQLSDLERLESEPRKGE